MKKIFFTIFIALFFTACTGQFNLVNDKPLKINLIQKADESDLEAMILLNKYYKYPYTKEGLKNYTLWYENILKSNNKEYIYKLALIYLEYSSMFINGEEKATALLKKASVLGYKKADLKLINLKLKKYKTKEALSHAQKIQDYLNEEELSELYKIYSKRYKRKEASDLLDYMKEKNYATPFDENFTLLRKYMYNKANKNNYNSFINEVITSKNIVHMEKLAKYLKDRLRYKDSIRVYKELLKINYQNADVYYELAKIYERSNTRDKHKKDTEKSKEFYKKAIKYGHKEASYKLLISYSSKKELMNEYLKLKEELEKTEKGKLSIVKYLRYKSFNAKANILLEELALNGNEDAILSLALNKPSRFNFDPDAYNQTKKWQKYIKEEGSKSLQQKYLKELKTYNYSRVFPNELDFFNEQELKDENILTYRELYKKNKYRNKEYALKYLKLAVEANDVKSAMDLHSYYLYTRGKKDFKKAVLALEPFAKKGDKESIYKLSQTYKRPPYLLEKHKDINKALEYLEQLAQKGDEKAQRRLIDYYLCSTCEKGKVLNYSKAYIYTKMLHEKSYPRYTATLAWLYNHGYGVEIDLQKAKKLYEQAAKDGYDAGYYYLAWLYYSDKETKDTKFIRIDYKEALKYLKKGAQKGHSNSINLLGLFYEKGYGVKKDIQQAIAYYKQVANYNTYAAFHLGRYYRDNKEYKKAIKYFEISSRSNKSNALVELGIIYESGLGVDKDINKAIKYYEKAYSNTKDKSASYNIALIYHYGKGRQKIDLKKAKQWYLLSGTKKAKKQLSILEKKLKKNL